MCGIAGILKFRDTSLNLANIRFMTDGMSHRGPDDEGFAFFDRSSPKVWSFGGQDTPLDVYATNLPYAPTETVKGQAPYEATLALGHRRLAILDLSVAGHQPMSTEDRRYWIVYNGEVYNFLEIREALEKEGEFFYSQTDTEVILKAYRRWGADCLKRFNGMWAFAIWDNHDKVLFCARDRIGIKPFYYYLTDRLFLFASDIKTLIASNLYPAEPNWEGVYHAMSFYCAPRPMTCFKGVRALEQAHWMSIDLEGQVQKRRYWQMPVGEIDYSKSEEQWVEQLEHILRLAVKRRLVADVPVGTFMSGGIDSTTITAIAAQEHPGIKAFTLGFEAEAKERNELSQAKATAQMYPLQHLIKVVQVSDIIEDLKKMVVLYEEPHIRIASANYVISSLVKKNKISVVLNGLGADELFSGYQRHNLLKVWKSIKPYKGLLSLIPNIHPRIMAIRTLSSLEDIYEYYVYKVSPFKEYQKKEFWGSMAFSWNSFKAFKEIYGLYDLNFNDPLFAICYMDMINYIGNHHVYRVDQFTMNFSIESRFPFLDHDLIELACRMPSYYKVRNGYGKYCLRRVSEKLIHHSSLTMKKKGFGLPTDLWIRKELNDFVVKKLESLNYRDFFNKEIINSAINETKNGRIKNYSQLHFLLSLELWIDTFF